MSNTSPGERARLEAEIAKWEKRLAEADDEDVRALYREKLATLNAQRVALGGTIIGDVVGGNKAERDYIEHQEIHQHGAPTAGPDEAALRSIYLSDLIERLNRVRIVGGDEWAERVRLSGVYTALLTDVTPKREAGDDSQDSHPVDAERLMAERKLEDALSAVDLLDRDRHLVLLGGPGSGKSTFANFVVMCLAGACLGRNDVNLEQLAQDTARRTDSRCLWFADSSGANLVAGSDNHQRELW